MNYGSTLDSPALSIDLAILKNTCADTNALITFRWTWRCASVYCWKMMLLFNWSTSRVGLYHILDRRCASYEMLSHPPFGLCHDEMILSRHSLWTLPWYGTTSALPIGTYVSKTNAICLHKRLRVSFVSDKIYAHVWCSADSYLHPFRKDLCLLHLLLYMTKSTTYVLRKVSYEAFRKDLCQLRLLLFLPIAIYILRNVFYALPIAIYVRGKVS